jgi:hemerythrin superfamily protein
MDNKKMERIYDVLRAEHDAVDALFKKAKSADAPAERSEIFNEIYRQLLSHAHAEQKTVYDRVKEKVSEPELIDEAEQEHTEIEQRLELLRTVDPTKDAWKDQLKELEERVKHHVKDEEHDMFKEMKEVVSDEDANIMATDFQVAKQKELEGLMAEPA